MRKYLVPLAVFLAIGAVIIILVKSGEEPAKPKREPGEVKIKPKPQGTEDPYPLEPRQTPTPLERHRWLSELERSLGRDDLSHAHYFRGKVCEDLDTILQDSELTRNLLNAIRKYGVESDDPRQRDVVLPILRVLEHPEATQMIAEEYYKAQSETEQIMLLEAMAHAYHDSEQASVWAVERALNSDSEEHRARAFEIIRHFTNHPELIYRTATQIYAGTTRPEQKIDMIRAIGDQSGVSESARTWLRKKMRNPRPDEIIAVIGLVEGWGNEDDAAVLETLAMEYPAHADFMRERARAIRRAIRERAGEDPGPMEDPEREREPEQEPRDE
ncbi:MAG: hypothetical protein ACYTG3_07705 [Planctomycetota bacterium]